MNTEDWSSTTIAWLGVASIAGAIVSAGPDLPVAFTAAFIFAGIFLAMIALSRHFREIDEEKRDGTP